MIIIGTGAGGGTLAHRLEPSGKQVLLLERGGYFPREPENWAPRRCSPRAATTTRDAGTTSTATSSTRIQYYVGGNTKVYGAPSFVFASDFHEVKHYGGTSPCVAHLLCRPRALLRPGRTPLFRPRRRAGGPHGAAARAPSASRRDHEPRVEQLHDALLTPGHLPVPLPLGIELNESSPEQAAACAATRSMASRAPSTARRTRTSSACAPALQAAERDPPHPRQGHAPRDGRDRTAGEQGGRRREGKSRRTTAATSSSCRAAPRTPPPSSCAWQMTSTPPASANSLRASSGATTWPPERP